MPRIKTKYDYYSVLFPQNKCVCKNEKNSIKNEKSSAINFANAKTARKFHYILFPLDRFNYYGRITATTNEHVLTSRKSVIN